MVTSRDQYDGLAAVYLPIAVAVFALIALTLLWFVVRYRARPGRVPGQRTHSTPLEIAYLVLLALITAFLVTMSFRAQSRIDGITDAAAQARAVRIDVVAAQWNWRFDYVGQRGLSLVSSSEAPREFVLPAGRRILFHGRSLDVLHDFWIPDVRFQRQVWPDHTETWALVFPKPGRYQGVCAWFCGLDHDRMDFVVRAVPPARYAAWLRTAQS